MKTIIEFIKDHGFEAYRITDTQICVMIPWTRNNGQEHGITAYCIPATLKAAKEILGY